MKKIIIKAVTAITAIVVIAGVCMLIKSKALSDRPTIAILPTCETSSPHALIDAANEVSDLVDVKLYSLLSGKLAPAENVDLGSFDLVFIVGNSHENLRIKDKVEEAKKKTKVVVVAPKVFEGNIDLNKHPDIHTYWFNRSRENFKRLMVYLGANFLGVKAEVEKPVIFPDIALYHPEGPKLFTSSEKYLEWYSKKRFTGHSYDPGKLSLGIIFFKSDYTKEDLRVLKALVKKIEDRGCNAIPLYSSNGAQHSKLFMKNGKSLVDAVISINNQINWKNHRKGIEDMARINVPFLFAPVHYHLSPDEWKKDAAGLGPDMVTPLTYSEMNGMYEPIVIAGKVRDSEGRLYKEPIDFQIDWRVDRAISWAKLKRMKNSGKKIAFTYYSEGGGKANVGADIDYYLDAQSSLVKMFKQMKKRGYNLGSGPLPDRDRISKLMMERGSNIGVWNSKEIEKRAKQKSLVLIPMKKYMKWYNHIDKKKRAEVEKKWGKAPGNIMVYEKNNKKFIVIPKIQFGNILLVPHPTWGYLQNKKVMYSTKELAPHHQYIAFWLWLQHEYKADAVVSIFTQVSLMPGKQCGLSRKDWGGILLGNLPNIHPFPIQANGGLHNKRKANALIIDYMPTVVSSGLYYELADIRKKIGFIERTTVPTMKDKYFKSLKKAISKLKIHKELKIDLKKISQQDLIGKTTKYLSEIEKEFMPYGPHTLGEYPKGKAMNEMIFSMLGKDYMKDVKNAGGTKAQAKKMVENTVSRGIKPGPAQTTVLGKTSKKITADLTRALDYKKKVMGASQEILQILNALESKYILPGPMDDPIRNPDALPTGRNPQPFDPRAYPTKEAWATGKLMANQLIKQHRKDKGEYPKKLAFVLWSSETTKNHGVTEAEILYLLGVKPVWRNGKIKDIELIRDSELKRPRIDIVVTVSGTYRDHFGDKIELIDRAVRLAASQKGKNNYVRINSENIAKGLEKAGYGGSEAKEASKARVFSEALNAYSPGIQFAIPAGDSWKDDKKISDLYIDRMSHIYGKGIQGKAAKEVFKQNLNSIDAAVFSRSSNVYGILEHPMVAAYFGGLKMAVRNTTGKKIGMYISNLRDPSGSKVETLDRFYNRELRSRYFNPKWIKGMKEHGYDGTRYMDSFVENLWVWDVTSPDMVTEDNWNQVYNVYVKDKHNLKMKEYFDKNNPYAMQNIISTMIEVKEKGYWHPTKEVFENMVKVYAQSVAKHGVSGSYGSTDMVKHRDVTAVLQQMKGLPDNLVKQYREQVSKSDAKLQPVKGYELKDAGTQMQQKRTSTRMKYFIAITAILIVLSGWFFGARRRD